MTTEISHTQELSMDGKPTAFSNKSCKRKATGHMPHRWCSAASHMGSSILQFPAEVETGMCLSVLQWPVVLLSHMGGRCSEEDSWLL